MVPTIVVGLRMTHAGGILGPMGPWFYSLFATVIHSTSRSPTHRRPRLESRADLPRGSPCARPWALVRATLGARVVEVVLPGGPKHLPVVRLKRVA